MASPELSRDCKLSRVAFIYLYFLMHGEFQPVDPKKFKIKLQEKKKKKSGFLGFLATKF